MNNIEVLAVLSSREINLVEKFDVALVFSTVKLDYQVKPIMIMDTIFNEETKLMVHNFLETNRQYQRVIARKSDYTEMFQVLLKKIEANFGELTKNFYNDLEILFRKNGLTINQKEVQPMIQDILTDHNIQITSEAMDWKESIRFGARPLLNEGAITENYIDEMIHSVEEYGPYIVLAPHMALAHARPEDGAKKLGLSLTVFQEPVSFGESDDQQVSVMFCLSAIDSFSHLNIMKSLVNLIRATNKIEKLSKATDINVARTILLKQ